MIGYTKHDKKVSERDSFNAFLTIGGALMSYIS